MPALVAGGEPDLRAVGLPMAVIAADFCFGVAAAIDAAPLADGGAIADIADANSRSNAFLARAFASLSWNRFRER